jgi:uncharacterized protein
MRTAVVLTVLAAAASAHAETPIPPAPDRFVTDRAGFLTPGTAADIDSRLGRYQTESGHQIIVYIDRTTGGAPVEDWAVRAFERWRIGRRGIDDGAALFMFTDDHRLRIEVGYGLEDRVPDARAARIIAEQIVPRVRAGDHDGAVRAGVGALMAAAGGAAAPGPAPAPVPVWMLIAGAIVFLFFIGFLVTHPSLAWLLLINIRSGRGRRGGFGGGFSGGGGRSGGGGASGSW